MGILSRRGAWGVVTGSALLLVAATTTSAGAASEMLTEVTCTVPSNRVTTFSPALTGTPQAVTISTQANYGPCVSLTHPDITSGTASGQTSSQLSCLDLLKQVQNQQKITWNSGETSIYQATTTATIVGALVVNVTTGTVTEGLFEGAAVQQVQIAPATTILACTLGVGTVPSVNSTVTLQITGV